MWVKITCEEWKIWEERIKKRHKKLRLMDKTKGADSAQVRT